MLVWLQANYKDVLLAILAIDSALIPLFPSAGILGKIKQLLSGITS